MKKIAVILTVLLALPATAYAWPWSQDMMNQPSIKPQEGTPKAFPKRSVPTTGFATKFLSRDDDGIEELVNPVAATPESIAEGKTLYAIYCASCHGKTGQSESPIAEKIGAMVLTDEYVQVDSTEGWIWGTITFGGAVMPAYGVPNEETDYRGANDLSVTERWHVVNYIKHQLKADAEAVGLIAAQ